MLELTIQERLFLKKFYLSLRKNTTSTEKQAWLTQTIEKLSSPIIKLSNDECLFLKQKLYDRMEDACDCRNEIEIDQIRCLLHKMKTRGEL